MAAGFSRCVLRNGVNRSRVVGPQSASYAPVKPNPEGWNDRPSPDIPGDGRSLVGCDVYAG